MTTIKSDEALEQASGGWGLYRREKRSHLDLALAVGSPLVTVAAFALNMGWVRVMMLLTTLPLLLLLLSLILGLVVYWRRYRSKVFSALCITHPLSYILLSDVGDHGPWQIFFGLVSISPTNAVGDVLSALAVVCMVLTFGLALKLGGQIWKRR